MNKFFKIISYILSLVQYVVWLVVFLLLVGVAGIFFGGQRSHGNFIFDYGNFIIKVPIIFPLLTLFMTIAICFITIKLLKIWSILLLYFSDGKYFNTENLKYIKNSFLFLLSLTIFQFIINLIINYLNTANVSGLFDFSIKNYLVNVLFLILNYLLIIVFKKGEHIQKENEEIIWWYGRN